MNNLDQAMHRISEAHVAGRSLADYTTAEVLIGGSFTPDMVKEAIGKLAVVFAAQNAALALIVRHLQGINDTE